MAEGSPIIFPENGPNVSPAEVYEHLFPGNSYSSLRSINPMNIPREVAIALTQADIEAEVRLIDAIRSGYGFAFRLDIQRPDKFSLQSELHIIRPMREFAHRGWFGDAILEGERVGGLGVRHHSYTFVGRGQRILLDSPWDVKAVGIMRPTGEPSAIVLYKEGRKKDPKGRLVDRLVFSPGNLATNE